MCVRGCMLMSSISWYRPDVQMRLYIRTQLECVSCHSCTFQMMSLHCVGDHAVFSLHSTPVCIRGDQFTDEYKGTEGNICLAQEHKVPAVQDVSIESVTPSTTSRTTKQARTRATHPNTEKQSDRQVDTFMNICMCRLGVFTRIQIRHYIINIYIYLSEYFCITVQLYVIICIYLYQYIRIMYAYICLHTYTTHTYTYTYTYVCM